MTSPRPRYQEVADSLRRAIETGAHPIGAHLPPETELAASFGVSRHTIRESLRLLRELGLVNRRQGSGTQVVARDPDVTFGQSLASLDDLLQYAASTSFELEPGQRIVARGALARMLGAAPGRAWLAYRGLRRAADSTPICVTDVYIAAELSAVAPHLAGRTGAIYRTIEAVCGIEVKEVRQEIAAETLDAETASRLDATPGSPALRILRRYHDAADRLFEVSVSRHPADRFTYSMRIRRDSAG